MPSIDSKLQQRIDQILMDNGEYSPIELLLAESRLLYNDYESWMNGEIDYLEDVLFGDPDHIKTMLQQAQSYVAQLPMLKARPLLPVPQYNVRQAKQFSRNPSLEKIFNTRYEKADDQPQMDLFVDGGAGNLINGIVLELSNNDFIAARRLLEQLYDIQPDNSKLNDLEVLVRYAEQSENSPMPVVEDLYYLQNQLTAMAQTHMAARSRGYLVTQWRRLTKALSSHSFDPAQPELHTSFSAIQSLDWNTAKQAIENEPQWRNHPVLLLRHVHCCTRLWQLNDALLSWFYLCWLFPQDTDINAAQADSALKSDWLEFLDLEPELDPKVFPAWYILNKPGLIKTLPDLGSQKNTPCDETYKIMQRMLAAQQSDKSILPGMDISLRQELLAVDPVFFQHFIKRIGG